MNLKKIISIILSVVLMLSATSFNTVVFAVSLPTGVTESEAQKAVSGTEKLLASLLKSNKINIKDLIEPMIYSDETVSSLLTSLYGSLGENTEELKAVGIDVSKDNIIKSLSDYPEVQKVLTESESIETVDLSNVKWGVSDKKTFSKAVSAVVSPFNDILYMLLCSGQIKVADLITVKGKNGYQNAIIPLLNSLDCKVTLTQEQFSEDAKNNKNSMIYNILMQILTIVDKLEKSPIDTLVTILPKFAYFNESGKFKECFDSLLSPITEHSLIKIAILLKIINLDSLNFDAEVILNDTLKSMSAETGLTFTEIDFKELSECGTFDGATFNSDKGKAYVVIMSYLADLLKQNKNNLSLILENLTGQKQSIDEEMISALLSSPSEDIVKMVIILFNGAKVAEAQDYKYPTVTFSTVTYTPNLTERNYKRVLNGIDSLIDEFVLEYSDYKSINSLLTNTIYTNANISALLVEIYKMLEKEGLSELLTFAGIDTTPAGVAKYLTESDYNSVKNTLIKYSSWEKVNLNGVSWGFYNGSRRGFENAFAAILRPLSPILNMMLKGETLVIADSIKINGANGYNDAVIPILEALGVSKYSIKTSKQYLKDDSKDAVIKNITSPIFDLIDDLMKKPVKTALEILPNIIYFIESGNLEVLLNNLLLPVTSLTQNLGSASNKVIDTSKLTVSLDFNTIFKSLEKELGIKLKTADIKKLYSFGELKTEDSKRTVNGKKTTYSYLQSDGAAVLVTVLRYLVDTLKLPENSGLLTDSLGGAEGGTFSLYASQIFSQFEGMTTDEIIEWLYNLLFKERVIVPFAEEEQYTPTIIYKEQPKNYTPFFIAGGVALLYIAVAVVFYLNRKKLYY